MSALSIQPTYPIFTDIDGQPLEQGSIWIGAANLDPQVNPINVYWDSALTLPAAQPIRTNGGYPVNNGTPARIYVNSDYSIRVMNRNGSVVYSAAADTERYGNIITLAGIDFTQAGTGAVTRTAQSKMRDVVNVKDFGAVGNGSTDDTTSIQNALNTGKSITIDSDMICLISSHLLTTADKQIIYLEGVIKASSAMPEMILSTDLHNIELCGNGTLDGNLLADNGFKSVATAKNPTGLTVTNITIKNTKNLATAFNGGICVLSSAGKASTYRHKDVTVRGCKLYNIGDLGGLIAYSDGVIIDNNIFDSCKFHGCEAVNCTDVLITNNISQDCLQSGIGVGDNTINWVMSNNVIRNCFGDGSITCEHNSPFGTITNNTIIDANTQGVNISFGTPSASPLDKVQGVVCSDNYMRQKAGITTHLGINYYSSTGTGTGEGVVISNNIIDGFNVGIAYQYSVNGSISNNAIMNLSGTSSKAILAVMCTGVNIEGNTCRSDTGDHSIQLLSYAGTDSDRCNVSNNYVLSSGTGTKALVKIDGTGVHSVINNRTSGALNYVTTTAASVIEVGANYGNLAGAAYAGSGTYHSSIGTGLVSSTVGAAGAASALPANPLGYVTCFVIGVGNVKIPYYNV